MDNYLSLLDQSLGPTGGKEEGRERGEEGGEREGGREGGREAEEGGVYGQLLEPFRSISGTCWG